MRPIPISADMKELFGPEAVTKVWAAPGGDLTDEDIAPVEAVTHTLDDGTVITNVILTLEDGELSQLEHGWLVIGWFGDRVPVFPVPVVIHRHQWVLTKLVVGPRLVCQLCGEEVSADGV